jgi:hypothetical protein
MADINIQRKKASPSPWLLVLLAAVLVAVGAYFFLRPDPADEPTPPLGAGATAATGDTLALGTAADSANAREQRARQSSAANIPAPDTASNASATVQGAEDSEGSADPVASLSAQAATNPAAPDYARDGLQKLTTVLVALTDSDDLRDATTTEQRDNLTSATNRLGEPNASLRPGFVAAAALMRAMQQKAYPDLEAKANDLTRLAGQLSGRSATAADQQQNKRFLTQAADMVRVLNEPAH